MHMMCISLTLMHPAINPMPSVFVNGQEITIGDKERLNGIQVAERAGVDIPRYCWHPGLSVVASCRMCLVEAGKKDSATGKITMQPKVVPACQTPATDGTVFVTNSPKVIEARAMVEEDLLLRHPRSEEHTSELQSPYVISYAVFCLK